MAFELLWAKYKKKPLTASSRLEMIPPTHLCTKTLKKPSKPWCGPFVSIDQLNEMLTDKRCLLIFTSCYKCKPLMGKQVPSSTVWHLSCFAGVVQ